MKTEMNSLKQSLHQLSQHCEQLRTACAQAESMHRQDTLRLGGLALATAIGSIVVFRSSFKAAAAQAKA